MYPDVIILTLKMYGLEKVRRRDLNIVAKRLHDKIGNDIHFAVDENNIYSAVEVNSSLFYFDGEDVCFSFDISDEYIREYVLWYVPRNVRKKFYKIIEKYVKRVLENDE